MKFFFTKGNKFKFIYGPGFPKVLREELKLNFYFFFSYGHSHQKVGKSKKIREHFLS